MEKQRQSFPLRAGEELNNFVKMAVEKSGRSKNAVIKACIQIAKENQESLFKKVGVEHAETK